MLKAAHKHSSKQHMAIMKTPIAKPMLRCTAIAIVAVFCLAASGGGLPYPTASTVSQLIADINYANNTGGAITINLAAGTSFLLKSADNTTDGGNGFPVIGATKPVALTLIGNGDIIKRTDVTDRYYVVKNPFRLFDLPGGISEM
jgi:hypothetical protein